LLTRLAGLAGLVLTGLAGLARLTPRQRPAGRGALPRGRGLPGLGRRGLALVRATLTGCALAGRALARVPLLAGPALLRIPLRLGRRRLRMRLALRRRLLRERRSLLRPAPRRLARLPLSGPALLRLARSTR
jgi:hypothetical protein